MTTRKPITESRDAQLIRAAKMRALVTAYLSKQNAPVSKAQMEADLAAELEGINLNDALAYQLTYMTRGNLIKRIDEPGNRPLYAAINSDHELVHTKVPKLGVTAIAHKTPNKPTSTNTPSAPKAQHHMAIDMVKSTGRVRISTQYMVIEIGVVD
jgi:hypothetical protein